jgi:uncharacterized protein YjbJ (UPF0337 family)
MRKLIDALALTGFALSASLTAALVISYYQFENIKKQAVENLTGQITGAVTDKLSSELEGQVEKALPKIPTTTGPALPF